MDYLYLLEEELLHLKKLVTQLLARTQLLSSLLKDAGITVPAEPALEKISPLKWSNKINVVSALKLINKVETSKSCIIYLFNSNLIGVIKFLMFYLHR